jgi:hypothetical protein
MWRPVYLRGHTFGKNLNRKPLCNRILAVSIIRRRITRILGYVLFRLTPKKNALESCDKKSCDKQLLKVHDKDKRSDLIQGIVTLQLYHNHLFQY